MKIRVRGVGDVNRKSIAGTLTGLIGGLLFSVGVVLLNQLPTPFIALAVVVAVASTILELCSPRGTDDFTMATGNALICWAFGAWVLSGS
jgi:dolichol kinase